MDSPTARSLFPRGLVQPNFRSGADALLLAAFVPERTPMNFVELGSGGGMASCALALRLPKARGVGLDCDTDAVEAAQANALRLELDERLTFQMVDVRDNKGMRALYLNAPGTVDVVLTNPPYRREGAGHPSACVARQRALCGPEDTLDTFCAAAFALLRHHGHFCLIFTASRLSDVLTALRRHHLGARRLRCVHTRHSQAAHAVLVEARKNSAEDLTLEAPLILHATPRGNALSIEARTFCPWLTTTPHPS